MYAGHESAVCGERWKGCISKRRILKLVQALRYILQGDKHIKILFHISNKISGHGWKIYVNDELR
jgi:hypothetical protein